MKVSLLVVGKTTDKHLQALVEDYKDRIGHYLNLECKVIPELKGTQALSEPLQKQKEGELILQNVGENALVVLLDERGKMYRSIEFASQLEKWMGTGRNLVFVIGGPYGFSQKVYDRADALISLSAMTFSHQMIRLLFMEQLYRACTILHHEKYHHE